MDVPVRSFVRPMWIMVAILMVADAVTTYLVLVELPDKEGNPLAVWAINTFGLAAMCIAKALIGVLMGYRLALLADRGHRFEFLSRMRLRFWLGAVPQVKVQRSAIVLMAFTIMLMGLVVGNNIRAVIQVYGGF